VKGRHIRAGIAAWLLLAAVAANAQQGREVPVFSAELALVKVTVSVGDSRGETVRGLTARDFAVREDGHEVPVAVCARADDPAVDANLALDLALLVDTSESMLENLRLSQQAAARFLTDIPHARDLLVVLFDQQRRVLRFDSERPEDLFAALAAVPAGGNTALRDAIDATLADLHSRDGRTAMVLLTDGHDTVSRVLPAALDRTLQGSPVTIYPIAVRGADLDDDTAGEAYAFLEHLARITGGRAFRLTQERSLPAVLSAILADLRGQYVIGYAPPRSLRESRYRKIQVEVRRRRGLSLRHRPGYRPLP
jgi:Ca-activated chloride channel family protein